MNFKTLGKLRGGIKFPLQKAGPAEDFSNPQKVVLSLMQQKGIILKPLVSKGESVLLGQKVADSSRADGVPLHSPVSGRVLGITPCTHSLTGEKTDAIVIESDGINTKVSPKKIYSEYFRCVQPELISAIKEAGILGLGGEAEAVHEKYNKGKKDVDTFILNAVESSPYISCDSSLTLENAKAVVDGIKIAMYILDAARSIIALRKDDRKSYETYSRLIYNEPNIFISKVSERYPQGEERLLVKAVLNREIACGEPAVNKGVIVSNIATVYSISRLMKNGENLTSRIVTVCGLKSKTCRNIRVRNGTLVSELADYLKLDKEEIASVVVGDAMRGKRHQSLDFPLIKANRALFFFSDKDEITYKNFECVSCGSCVKVCPVGLLPNKINAALAENKKEKLKKYMSYACIECGSCCFVCPSMINITGNIQSSAPV